VSGVHPVRNDALLLCPVHRAVLGSAAALDPRIIPAELDAPSGFTTVNALEKGTLVYEK